MRIIPALALMLSGIFSAAHAYADTYEFDHEHTHIVFYVNHLGFSDMIGLFTSYDGSFSFDPDHPERSRIDVTLRPKGIRTTSEALDRTLQGKDFFHTDAYPDMRFVSTSVKVTGENTGDITGNLTLLGVTKPVVLHARFNKAGYHPVTSLYVAGFSADTTLKRSDFGIDYLIPMVADKVRIEIGVEGINQDRKKAEQLKKH